MWKSTIRIRVASAALMALSFGPASVAAREPRWQKSQALCRQLRGEGWKGSPEGPGDPSTGEMRHGSIFVCRVRQQQPARAGAKPAQIDVFMQHGGGDNLTVIAQVWTAADRASVLVTLANTFARAARELEIPLPADMLDNVKAGESYEDEVGGLTFDISSTTRESEMMGQPDAKPNEIPLLAFDVSVEPTS